VENSHTLASLDGNILSWSSKSYESSGRCSDFRRLAWSQPKESKGEIHHEAEDEIRSSRAIIGVISEDLDDRVSLVRVGIIASMPSLP